MDVESGCGEWRVDLKSGAVPDLTLFSVICLKRIRTQADTH